MEAHGRRRGRGPRYDVARGFIRYVRNISRKRRPARGCVHRVQGDSHADFPLTGRQERQGWRQRRRKQRVPHRREPEQHVHLRSAKVSEHDAGRAPAAAVRDVPRRAPRAALPLVLQVRRRWGNSGIGRGHRRRRAGPLGFRQQHRGDAAEGEGGGRAFKLTGSRRRTRAFHPHRYLERHRVCGGVRGVDAATRGRGARPPAVHGRTTLPARGAPRGGHVHLSHAAVGLPRR